MLKELEWNEYPGCKKIANHPAGFSVVVPASSIDGAVLLFCPVCESCHSSLYDEISFRKFECCDKCAAKWAYPRAKDWQDGWRPSPEEIEQEIKFRTTTT